MQTKSAHVQRSALLRTIAVGTAVTTTMVLGGPSASGAPSKPHDPARISWSGPDPDGGYHCLRDTGGAGGQCVAEMGLGPWAIPASDGGYRCLRDTLGASGQCNEAMGLQRP